MDRINESGNLLVINLALDRKFTWNSNLEIVQLLLCAQNQEKLVTTAIKTRPPNGSQILYSRSLCNKVRNSDGYTWQKKNKRKTTRENQMLFRVNGVECLLAKYTRSAILPSFQRRCYFLRQNPSIVFFHYINVPSLTRDYKLCISRSTLSDVDIPGMSEMILFEQLTAMFDNFPTQIKKVDGDGFANLDIQSIVRGIVQSVMFQKQKKTCQEISPNNCCYVFSNSTDSKNLSKTSHSLSSNSKSSIGSDYKIANCDRKGQKAMKIHSKLTCSTNWPQTRQSDSCIDTSFGYANMTNLIEDDYLAHSKLNSLKRTSLTDCRNINPDFLSITNKKTANSNKPDYQDGIMDSETSINFSHNKDMASYDPNEFFPTETLTQIQSNSQDFLLESQTYIDGFYHNDLAYWGDIEGSIDIDTSDTSKILTNDDSIDISGDFNVEELSNWQFDDISQSEIVDMEINKSDLNIIITNYAPSWAPIEGGGNILIAGSGLSGHIFRQNQCYVLFGDIYMPAILVQDGLLKSEIPSQITSGEVGIKIHVGSQTTGLLIMFKYVDYPSTAMKQTDFCVNSKYHLDDVVRTWIFQKDSQLKVKLVDQLSLLEEEIMKMKVNTNSKLDLKSLDIENISAEMIKVRRWCCRDSLELVLARCCFTWCRRSLFNITGHTSEDSPDGSTIVESRSQLPVHECQLIDLPLIHAISGLGYLEFLRLILIWYILYLRQIRIFFSNNANLDESKSCIKKSQEKIEFISGLSEDSLDKNGFSALMWAGLKEYSNLLRLLAMWSPKQIMIQHKNSGLNLIDMLKSMNKSHVSESITDIVNRYINKDGQFLAPPTGQVNALWDCMGNISESDIGELVDIEDIMRLSTDCPTDEISSSINSRNDIDQNSIESSKYQSMDYEEFSCVNKNEVQMVCLAGRIIQAMPTRIKQNPVSSEDDFISCSNENVEEDSSRLWSEINRHSGLFRPALDRNRSFSYSSYSSAGAEGAANPLGSCRASNNKQAADDSGISTPFDDSRYLRSSPTQNREFNIDSPPPTTAEIADHFNAPACFMEADFSRLTLSDTEQKRLYEAAKLIQKCYRAYRQGKASDSMRKSDMGSILRERSDDASPCKKIFLTASKPISSQSQTQCIVNKVLPINSGDHNRSIQNVTSIDDQMQKAHYRLVTKRRFKSQENTESERNCQKEIEAAIIIQSYYRRYKQYAYYKKMCQAAVLIQNQFRWYVEHKKAVIDHSLYPMPNRDIHSATISQKYRNFSKKRSNTLPNTLGTAYGVLRTFLISQCRSKHIGPCLLPPFGNSRLN